MGKYRVYIVLAIFLVVVTAPIWYNIGKTLHVPEIKAETAGTECVESREYMRKNHMNLLNEWRDAVVRDRVKDYTSKTTGKTYEMSLQNTCMKCHQNKEQFCDRCHESVGVEAYCWKCHLEPGMAKGGTTQGAHPDIPAHREGMQGEVQ